MQKLITISQEQYDCMLKSYDEVMEELYDLRERLKSLTATQDDVAEELRIYELMDGMGCGRDEAELLLQDEAEAVAISQQKEGVEDGE